AAGGRFVPPFRQGLGEMGLVEGRNVAVEYWWADRDVNRLQELALDLRRHGPTVIAALGSSTVALAAKAAAPTVPIVFTMGEDPIKSGLVASYNLPGGNITGIVSMAIELGPKRLGLMHQVKSDAKRFGVLTDPSSPLSVPGVAGLQAAVAAVGGH